MKIWITSMNHEEDAEHLESLGVILGKNKDGNLDWQDDPHSNKVHGVPGRGQFHNCEVDEATLNRLNIYWMGRYVWGLEPNYTGISILKLPNIHTAQHGPTLEPYSEEKAKRQPPPPFGNPGPSYGETYEDHPEPKPE